MNEEVYLQRNLSCEEVDSDDLEGEMNMSDDEQQASTRQVIKKARKQERRAMGSKARANKYYVEVDTNIFQISLDCLNVKSEIATGDPEVCKGCTAVLNYKS